MTDEFTLRRAQKGDAQAFEMLVTPHEQMLWRVCWHYTHHQEDAADCLQEAMLKAWRAIKTYRGECSLSTWLYRIAATVCLDFLRKQKRLPPTESADHIRAAIDSLPAEMRTAIILYALQGFGYEEIAEVTSTSVGTVKSRINRARQKIAKFLADGNNPAFPSSDKMKGGHIYA